MALSSLTTNPNFSADNEQSPAACDSTKLFAWLTNCFQQHTTLRRASRELVVAIQCLIKVYCAQSSVFESESALRGAPSFSSQNTKSIPLQISLAPVLMEILLDSTGVQWRSLVISGKGDDYLP